MNRLTVLATATTISLLCIGINAPASAQSLKGKLVGAWSLDEGLEIFQGGKKVIPWSAGSLILDSSNHFSFFVIGKDRPKGSGDPRSPVGPVVAYYGTYTLDEANNTLIYKVEHATNPSFDGAVRTLKISFQNGTMTTTSSDVKTPQGTITPVNKWERVK